MNPFTRPPKAATLSSVSILLAVLSGLSFANSALDGFYIGASVGVQQTQTDTSTFASTAWTESSVYPFIETLANSFDSTEYTDSAIGALQLGYGQWILDTPFYVGLELFGNLARRNTSSTVNGNYVLPTGFLNSVSANLNTETEVALNDAEWGLDLRPGVALTSRTLLYGRVGMSFNQLQLESKGQLDVLDLFNHKSATSNIFAEDSENVTGLRLGIGLEQLITPHFTINMDYIYTDYGSIDTSIVTDVNNPGGNTQPGGFLINSDATVRTHAVMLGAHYYPKAQQSHKTLMNRVSEPAVHFKGRYVGIKGGILHTNATQEIETSATAILGIAPSNTSQLSETDSAAQNAGIGGIFAGYGQLLGNTPYYAGIEVFADVADRDTSSQATTQYSDLQDASFSPYVTTETDVKLNPVEFGIDARLGGLMTASTLFYGRIGVGFNEIKIESNNTYVQQANAANGTAISELNETEDKNVVGLRLGLGLEQMLIENFAVTADYIYTYYGHANLNAVGDTNGILGAGEPQVQITTDGFVNDTRVKVSSQAATLGLIYHF